MGKKSFFGADIQTLGAMASGGRLLGKRAAQREESSPLPLALQRRQARQKLKVAWIPATALVVLEGRMLLPRVFRAERKVDGTFPRTVHLTRPCREPEAAAGRGAGTPGSSLFDGDGDRIRATDAAGAVTCDQLLVLWSRDVLKTSGATIVADVGEPCCSTRSPAPAANR